MFGLGTMGSMISSMFGSSGIPNGFRRTKKSVGNSNSLNVQFPINVKLPDGRHRYFIESGKVVDRLEKESL